LLTYRPTVAFFATIAEYDQVIHFPPDLNGLHARKVVIFFLKKTVMDKVHDIRIVRFSGSHMNLEIDGITHDIDLAAYSHSLAQATQIQIENVFVSPSGYGLHWPDIDEDLSVDGLIGKKKTRPSSRATA
jgi:hypothetical protein